MNRFENISSGIVRAAAIAAFAAGKSSHEIMGFRAQRVAYMALKRVEKLRIEFVRNAVQDMCIHEIRSVSVALQIASQAKQALTVKPA